MIRIYNILVWLLFLGMMPFLPLLFVLSKKRRANMIARFGFQKAIPQKKPGQHRIWIHALSVGEVRSSFPFVQEFKKAHPDWMIVFTASTKTGFETAHDLFSRNKFLVDYLRYFPFDIQFSVKKVIRAVDPDIMVFTETDLWPGFLNEMQKKEIPVILINARLSQRSLDGYIWYRRMGLSFHKWLTHIMVQTRLDAARFEALGLPVSMISVCGNIKFDQPVSSPNPDLINDLRTDMGFGDGSRVLLAGSTHEGEEEILLKVYQKLKRTVPELKMIIAPRNPERSRKLLLLFESRGQKAACLSQSGLSNESQSVIFIDSLGLLATLYKICDIAFVGGSMVPCGGHNPLEPAAFGKPILFGPDMSDFLEISHLLGKGGAAVETRTAADLERELTNLFNDPVMRKAMGTNSRQVFMQHRGAVGRIIDAMEQLNIV